MQLVTKYILSKTNKLQISPEITPTPPGYSMFNTGGVEVEVGEFLYSLTCMIKPDNILETGTHLGISSAYFGVALQENNKGKVSTFEIIPELRLEAQLLWKDLEIEPFIDSFLTPSSNVSVVKETIFDILFLDSEPQHRFNELNQYWNQLKPGGFIIIHDLNSAMGHHGQTYHDVYDWPYGDFRNKIGHYFHTLQIQSIHFNTPRGLSLFQKTGNEFEITRYLKDTLIYQTRGM